MRRRPTDQGHSWARLTAGAVSYMLPLVVLLLVTSSQAKFTPPVVIKVVPSARGKVYYVDRGLDANIKVGNRLNVYRVIEIATGQGENSEALRILLGIMVITASQSGISTGRFIPDANTASNSLIRIKDPMKADLVIPKLKIDSSVLFQPGLASLQGQVVQGEMDKVARFVRAFTPSKLIVEGHTDSDGDEEKNQALSELRAELIKAYLINNYPEITPDMVIAQGYGETRPIVTNDTPENKALNRRIEIVVWE